MQCFRLFRTAERTLEEVEAVHIRQIKTLDGRDSVGQARFVERSLVSSHWLGRSRLHYTQKYLILATAIMRRCLTTPDENGSEARYPEFGHRRG